MRWSLFSVGWLGICLAIGVGLAGCGGDDTVQGEAIHLDIPPIPIENGEEILDRCFSWTLHNEEPLYVNSIRMRGTRGIHHSNWFYVDEDTFDGPDGEWPCRERGFHTANAALAGGVLFAQSTQTYDETQAFETGVVLRLPPRSRVVVDLHLINSYGEDLETDIDLEIQTIPEAQAHTFLQGFAINYDPLAIQERSRSEFTTECNFDTLHRQTYGRPLDFRIHYVLPHYHALGDMLRLEIVGGPNDGELLWEVNTSIGEVLGGIPEPHLGDMTGATGVRMTCGYENPRDEIVGSGVGDQEMCITFGFTDSDRLWHGEVLSSDKVGERDDGTHEFEGSCFVINALPNADTAE
jgi:hypothetical protein